MAKGIVGRPIKRRDSRLKTGVIPEEVTKTKRYYDNGRLRLTKPIRRGRDRKTEVSYIGKKKPVAEGEWESSWRDKRKYPK